MKNNKVKEMGNLFRNRYNLTPYDDDEEMGPTWILISQETKTKLTVSHHVGKRNYEDSVKMIFDLEAKRDKSTELPLFMSDDFDTFKKALVEVYSTEEQPEYKGRGRHPKPIKVPLPDLRYNII